MICVSLGKVSFNHCLKLLNSLEMAEIRLDLMNLNKKQVTTIFSSHPHLIATCRSGQLSERKRKELLLTAIKTGAAYVDLDLREDINLRLELREILQKTSCRLILSYHNFQETPQNDYLSKIIIEAEEQGADLIKLACFIHHPHDNARLLSLIPAKKPVVVCGMGPLGRITRLAALFCGSPFAYASWDENLATAPGQIDYQTLQQLVKVIKNE